MKKFVVLYFAPESAMEQMRNASPEDMKRGHDNMDWQRAARLRYMSPCPYHRESVKELQ